MEERMRGREGRKKGQQLEKRSTCPLRVLASVKYWIMQMAVITNVY